MGPTGAAIFMNATGQNHPKLNLLGVPPSLATLNFESVLNVVYQCRRAIQHLHVKFFQQRNQLGNELVNHQHPERHISEHPQQIRIDLGMSEHVVYPIHPQHGSLSGGNLGTWCSKMFKDIQSIIVSLNIFRQSHVLSQRQRRW